MIESKVESHMAQNLEFPQLLPPLKKSPSYLTSSIWRIVAFPSHILWLRPLLGQLQRDVEHVIDLILSMDQGKSGGLCSNSGTLNWHFFVSGLTVIVTTMMVQSAQYVDVTNLKDLDEIIFWIDCSICGEWAHNLCAFEKNSITRQYVCINC